MKNDKKASSNCESCVFFEEDDFSGENICTINLDEDDYEKYISGKSGNCPYYRYFDEYKSVQKQN